MLFDIRPKTSINDLYKREIEFNTLKRSLELGIPLIVISGVRRIGKTSLLKAAFHELEYPHVLIDVREVFEEFGYVTKDGLLKEMAEFFTENLSFFEKIDFKIKEFLSHIKAFQVSTYAGSGVHVEFVPSSRISFTGFLRTLDLWAKEHSTRFVIAFDEAQYLRFSGRVRFNGIIAWSVDNLRNLTIIITGSEIGVLRDFLGIDDPNAPLYGRYIHEIKLNKFSRDESIEFLRKGFNELGISILENELSEVVEHVDGIPGWLTLYGYYRGIEHIMHKEALEKVFEYAVNLVKNELEKVITPSRQRYLAILDAITHGANRWSEIKTYTEYKTKRRIDDKNFNNLLSNLIKYGIIERHNDEYLIIDPLVKYTIKYMI